MSSSRAMSCSPGIPVSQSPVSQCPASQPAPFPVFAAASPTCLLVTYRLIHNMPSRNMPFLSPRCSRPDLGASRQRLQCAHTLRQSSSRCEPHRSLRPCYPQIALSGASTGPEATPSPQPACNLFHNRRLSQLRHAMTSLFLVCSLSSLFATRKPGAPRKGGQTMIVPLLIETAQIGRAWSSNGRNQAIKGTHLKLNPFPVASE
jgi:hypothetical protein